MRGLLLTVLGAVLAGQAVPAQAAVLSTDARAHGASGLLPETGMRLVTEAASVAVPPASPLCRTGDAMNASGGLSVLAGRPVCAHRTRRVASRRLDLGGARALGGASGVGGRQMGDPFGGLGAFGSGFAGSGSYPWNPTAERDRPDEGETGETAQEAVQEAFRQTGRALIGYTTEAVTPLPAASLTAIALPALKPAPRAAPQAAAAPTPVPPAAWLFASGVGMMLLRRKARPSGPRRGA